MPPKPREFVSRLVLFFWLLDERSRSVRLRSDRANDDDDGVATTRSLARRGAALCVNDDDRWDNLDSESKSTLLRKEEDKLMAAKNAGASL